MDVWGMECCGGHTCLILFRYLWGEAGQMGKVSRDLPHSGHYPPSGLGSMKVRWREIWHEREERKEERDGEEREQAPY